MNNQIVILAPHLKYPLRNGGDIYIENIGHYLSLFREQVTILGANTITDYQKGGIKNKETFQNELRSKYWAAFRTLVFKDHYLIEKFLTPTYIQKARELVQEKPDAILIYSTISTASLDLTTRPVLIMTQNDEISYYRNLKLSTKDPIQKLISKISENWLINLLKHSKDNYIYAHISETDQGAYSNYINRQKSIVVPAGVEPLPPFTPIIFQDNNIRLLFCGSLSVQMNFDSLLYFKEYYWDLLRGSFNDSIEIWIAGSNPTTSVINLCNNQGWLLYPNINDEDLKSLYEKATFGILPFEYSAGAKIKLLNCLAHGLPVMATSNIKNLPGQDFPPNLYSSNPQEWLQHLQSYKINRYDISGRIACHKFAMKYTWPKIIEKMDSDMVTYWV